MGERLTEAQRGLLNAVASCKYWNGSQEEPSYYMRPRSEYWYDARPENAKLDRLIARGLLAEHKSGFISITDAGRSLLKENPNG